jgi:hypothetical protein
VGPFGPADFSGSDFLYLYIARRLAADSPIKIGYVKTDLRQRLHSFTNPGICFDTIYELPPEAALNVEIALHARLASLSIYRAGFRTEWYDITVEEAQSLIEAYLRDRDIVVLRNDGPALMKQIDLDAVSATIAAQREAPVSGPFAVCID